MSIREAAVTPAPQTELQRQMHRWLLAQKLTLAGFILLVRKLQADTARRNGRPVEELEAIEPKLRSAQQHLTSLLQTYDLRSWGQTLPPSAVNVLHRTEGQLPRDLRKEVERLHAELIVGKDAEIDAKEISPARAASLAQIVASVILYGTGDARRVARLANAILKDSTEAKKEHRKSWRGNRKSWKRFLDQGCCEESGFTKCLTIIRDRNALAWDRLSAVAHLCEIIDGAPWCEQVENALFHQCFAWPLLVTKEHKSGIALPLLVDAQLPVGTSQRSAVEIHGLGEVISIAYKEGVSLSFFDWLKKAREAAWHLWRSQHGSSGDFRDVVERFTALFDFSWASDIVRDAIPDLVSQPGGLRLEGGSASVYLSQILLSQLLGRRSYMNCVVTGEIGERIKDKQCGDELLDYEFKGVSGIDKKLRYVFDADLTDVIVVPPENGDDVTSMIEGESNLRQTAHVISGCAKLSNVADVAQSVGWRRTQYIRCPEVGLGAIDWKTAWNHARGRGEEFYLGTVETVLKELAKSDASVLELPANIWPVTVARAFEYINTQVREFEPTPGGSFVRAKYPPASLSWAFIRMVSSTSEEFWQVVWQALGASPESFEQFCYSPTAAIAAQQLIRALSNFEPDRDCRSHRAPDLIAFIGFPEFREQFKEWKNKASTPLAPWAVISELMQRQEKLPIARHRSAHEGGQRVWAVLKNVRILLLADSHGLDDRIEVPVPQALDQVDAAQLRSLATFSYGFSHHNAAALLAEHGILGGDVHKVLIKLKSTKLIREFSGEYFLPESVRQQVLTTVAEPPACRADRHRAAARSLAPYTLGTTMPGLPLERALLPTHVGEALRHFKEAEAARDEAASEVLKTAHHKTALQVRQELGALKSIMPIVRRERQTIERAGLWPGRRLVHELMKRGKQDATDPADAEYLIGQIAEGWERHPLNRERIPVDPMLRLDSARAFSAMDPSQVKVSKDAWREEIRRRFQEALDACDKFPTSLISEDERKWNRLLVMCWYADWLADQKMYTEAAEYDNKVWTLKSFWSSEAGKNAVTAQWLERQADEHDEPMEAMRIYLLGWELQPQWHQFRFKTIGAANIAKKRLPTISEWIRHSENPFDEIGKFGACCGRDKRKLARASDDARTHVRSYWQTAANVMQNTWGSRVTGFQEAFWAALDYQEIIARKPHEEGWIQIRWPQGWRAR